MGRLRAARAILHVWPSRIGLRLLAFNLLLVFLPLAGILYLDVYEQRLLESQERSMIQQGRLVAAALGGGDAVSADAAVALLKRLERRGDARLRVFDHTSALLADSAQWPVEPHAAPGGEEYAALPDGRVRTRLVYRLGVWFVRARHAAGQAARAILAPAPDETGNTKHTGDDVAPEVRSALQGRYGAATRPTQGQRSLTLNSAVPIRSGDEVIGAVLVSQSTFRILQALYSVRLRVFEIVLASLAAAALLTILLSATIVRPIVRLRRAAFVLGNRAGHAPVSFPGSERRDEIGDLARALEEVTSRLDAHVRLLESFAADVSHEFRNPLASIRTAAELLADGSHEPDRRRFLSLLLRDVDRLERLVAGVRELARIDAQLANEDVATIDVAALLSSVVAGLRLTTGCALELTVSDDRAAHLVRASPERLAQVFENLLANACSFAPAGTPVAISVHLLDGFSRIVVADSGPGIPPEHLEQVFERFFTYRPAESPGRRDHAGLGLAIARAIVEGYGGSVTVANRPRGGAAFEVKLPTVDADSSAAVESRAPMSAANQT